METLLKQIHLPLTNEVRFGVSLWRLLSHPPVHLTFRSPLPF
jgi:hypothetical protein